MKHSAIFRSIQQAGSWLYLWLIDWKKKYRLIIAGVVYAVVYFIFAGLLPDYYIATHYTQGHKLVGLYSHLFRFCEFFGWITILLLIPPVTFLAAQTPDSQLKKRLKRFTLVALILLVSLPMATVVLDLQSDNMAPHEIRADIIENDPQLKDHFIKEPPPTDAQKQAYQNKMVLLREDMANWSVARYLHYLTIFLQTLQLVAIAVVTVAILMSGPSPSPGKAPDYKIALVFCALAIFVSYFWILMRVAFVAQKHSYFPSISIPVTEVALIVFSFVATVPVVLRLLSFYKRRQELAVLLGIVTIFTALLFGGPNWEKLTALLVKLFGRDAALTHYWGLCGVIIFIALFGYLGYIMKKPQDEICAPR